MLGGQDEFELVERRATSGSGSVKRVGSSSRPSVVGTCTSIICSFELFDGAAGREAGRQGVNSPGERDVEAVGEVGRRSFGQTVQSSTECCAPAGVATRPTSTHDSELCCSLSERKVMQCYLTVG
jgi:hypothetical protein